MCLLNADLSWKFKFLQRASAELLQSDYASYQCKKMKIWQKHENSHLWHRITLDWNKHSVAGPRRRGISTFASYPVDGAIGSGWISMKPPKSLPYLSSSLVAKPGIQLDRNLVCKFVWQCLRSIVQAVTICAYVAPAVTKRAMLRDDDHVRCKFDLWPWKGQNKNLGIMLCIIIRQSYNTNLEMIQTFCVFGFGPLVAKLGIRFRPKFGLSLCDLGVRTYQVSGQ
jgi:hypothetical protein